MHSKLERLALSMRRPPPKSGDLVPERVDADSYFKCRAKYEEEDRLSGTFPYDGGVQSMKDFYTGQDILITGGTGFIGKVLVEKLMRSSPEGGRIFLLLRGRKGLTAQQRVKAMLELPIFKLVMTENPEAADRVIAVDGDCSVAGLGLSPADRQILVDNVSIVFHCAATVRFDLMTTHMIMVNVRGTRDIVYLSKEMKKLKVFLHVSTAFCNATKYQKTPIPEIVLPQQCNWKTIIRTAEASERDGRPDVLDLIFEKLGSNHENNYTFTKALAESIVEEEACSMPSIIVRPTMVVASYEDPFGGWIDNLYGPMSIWDGIGQGVIRVHYGKPNIVLDYIPVDLIVKALLAAAWHRGLGYSFRNEPRKVDVVNAGTSDLDRHTFNDTHEDMQELFDVNSHRYILRYPRFYMTNNFWAFWLATIFSHLPLGFVMDSALRITGRKPLLLKIYRRLYFAQTKLLHFFSSNEFEFELNNQWKLQARLPQSDRERFSSVTLHYSTDFCHDIIGGIIKYVFKEKSYSAKESNRKIMYIVEWIQNVLLVVLVLWFILWLFR